MFFQHKKFDLFASSRTLPLAQRHFPLSVQKVCENASISTRRAFCHTFPDVKFNCALFSFAADIYRKISLRHCNTPCWVVTLLLPRLDTAGAMVYSQELSYGSVAKISGSFLIPFARDLAFSHIIVHIFFFVYFRFFPCCVSRGGLMSVLARYEVEAVPGDAFTP